MNLGRLKINKDYYLTFGTEILILFSGILVYKFAALNFGNEGFAQYALCRRTISFFLPLLSLGFAIGIPRFMANFTSADDDPKANAFFLGGLLMSLSFTLVVFIVVNLWSSYFSFLFFGTYTMESYMLPVSLYVTGLIFNALCYGFFRGKFMIISANIMQGINLGIAPLLILFYKDAYQVILYTGLLVCLVSLFFLFLILRKLTISFQDFNLHAKTLFKFGIQRIPGDFTLACFFALPAFFASHYFGIIMAGYIAFSISLLNMVGGVFGPFSLIMLPKSVRLIKENNLTELKQKSLVILRFTLIANVMGITFFELFAKEIISLYLGNNYGEIIICSRIVILASLGYTLYISLRSFLDAYHIRAVNTRNILVAFSVFVFLSFLVNFFSPDYRLFLFVFVLSMYILGIFTWLEYRKIFNSKKILVDL